MESLSLKETKIPERRDAPPPAETGRELPDLDEYYDRDFTPPAAWGTMNHGDRVQYAVDHGWHMGKLLQALQCARAPNRRTETK